MPTLLGRRRRSAREQSQRPRSRSPSVSVRRSTLPVTSASREDLHELIDVLPDDQVAALLADVKRRMTPRPPWTTEPFEWFGMIKDGPRNASSPEAIEAVRASAADR